MNYHVEVAIRLKDGVPDMIGKALFNAIRSAGYSDGVTDVSVGKLIELDIVCDPDTIDETVTRMCEMLLAHGAIERSSYRLTAYVEQPNSNVLKCPLSPWEPAKYRRKLVEPRRQVYAVDLVGIWPALGPYRIVRAEWIRPGTDFMIIRYSLNGVEVNIGWMLDVGKRTFIDALEDEIGKGRARSLRKLAGEISDHILRQLRVYGQPEPKLLDE